MTSAAPVVKFCAISQNNGIKNLHPTPTRKKIKGDIKAHCFTFQMSDLRFMSQGAFHCPAEGCDKTFTMKHNCKAHYKSYHDENVAIDEWNSILALKNPDCVVGGAKKIKELGLMPSKPSKNGKSAEKPSKNSKSVEKPSKSSRIKPKTSIRASKHEKDLIIRSRSSSRNVMDEFIDQFSQMEENEAEESDEEEEEEFEEEEFGEEEAGEEVEHDEEEEPKENKESPLEDRKREVSDRLPPLQKQFSEPQKSMKKPVVVFEPKEDKPKKLEEIVIPKEKDETKTTNTAKSVTPIKLSNFSIPRKRKFTDLGSTTQETKEISLKAENESENPSKRLKIEPATPSYANELKKEEIKEEKLKLNSDKEDEVLKQRLYQLLNEKMMADKMKVKINENSIIKLFKRILNSSFSYEEHTGEASLLDYISKFVLPSFQSTEKPENIEKLKKFASELEFSKKKSFKKQVLPCLMTDLKNPDIIEFRNGVFDPISNRFYSVAKYKSLGQCTRCFTSSVFPLPTPLDINNKSTVIAFENNTVVEKQIQMPHYYIFEDIDSDPTVKKNEFYNCTIRRTQEILSGQAKPTNSPSSSPSFAAMMQKLNQKSVNSSFLSTSSATSESVSAPIKDFHIMILDEN